MPTLRHAIVIGAALLAGCVQPPVHHPLPPPANIAAPYDRAWAAVIDHFADANIPIKTLEKASGLVVAEVLSVGVELSKRYADCGALVAKRATYNVRVTGDSAASQVRVSAAFANDFFECTSRGVFEQELLDEIRIRAAPRRQR